MIRHHCMYFKMVTTKTRSFDAYYGLWFPFFIDVLDFIVASKVKMLKILFLSNTNVTKYLYKI